jgi:hypothetical protein
VLKWLANIFLRSSINSSPKGFKGAQILACIILLQVAGGDSIDDLDLLSPSVVHRWLNLFHNSENVCLQRDSGAFIEPLNSRIKSLCDVNSIIVELMQKHKKSTVATLDMDATLIAANKKEAFFCYKGFSAYQPLNVWWAEQQMMIHTEFRNGNVNAGYEQLRLLKEAIKLLPDGVSEIRVRSDSAGYQHEFMDFCQLMISNRVTEEFKKAALQIPDKDWRPVYRNKPLGNKFFVTNIPMPEKNVEKIENRGRPGEFNSGGMWGESVIHWHRERCGRSEQAHSIIKSDFGGGKMPSGKFGVNAAWWWISIMAMNLQKLMTLAMDEKWENSRMKAIRFNLIGIPGIVATHGRQLFLRITEGYEKILNTLMEIRKRMIDIFFYNSG